MSKHTVTFRFKNNEQSGSITLKTEHYPKFYENAGYRNSQLRLCDVSFCEKDVRYVNWIDQTGFIPSKSKYCLSGLTHHRRDNDYQYPSGFDHTTSWRRKGDRWPLFVMTEPYDAPSEYELSNWHDYCTEYNMAFRIYEPSDLSLWMPRRTYMIFWWCPHFFRLDESQVLCHDDWTELKSRIKYDVIENTW